MENTSSQLFINSEQVGDSVSITLPGFDGMEEETTVHYLESGIGEPLLLIHGIGQSLYTWRNVFSELSENYRVIAVDLLGHGYSGRPDSFNYSMDSFSEMIRLFLDAKGIESAHMIGFSTGAMYMLRFLSLNPDRVANCIAIAPGGITDRMPPLVHKIKNPISSVFSRNLFTAGDVRKLLEECVYNQKLIDDRMVKQYYQPLSDGLSREALMYALRNFDMDTVAEGLIPLDHEVLVLWGKDDHWHIPSGSVYFQNVLSNGRYYLVKRTGHLLHEENPDKLLEVVFSYIPPQHPSYLAYEYTSFARPEQAMQEDLYSVPGEAELQQSYMPGEPPITDMPYFEGNPGAMEQGYPEGEPAAMEPPYLQEEPEKAEEAPENYDAREQAQDIPENDSPAAEEQDPADEEANGEPEKEPEKEQDV